MYSDCHARALTEGRQVLPLSIDAIDQFQVAISPYDVSTGNFTGGSINAITEWDLIKRKDPFIIFQQPVSFRQANNYRNDMEQTGFARLSGMRLQGAVKKINVLLYQYGNAERPVSTTIFI